MLPAFAAAPLEPVSSGPADPVELDSDPVVDVASLEPAVCEDALARAVARDPKTDAWPQ